VSRTRTCFMMKIRIARHMVGGKVIRSQPVYIVVGPRRLLIWRREEHTSGPGGITQGRGNVRSVFFMRALPALVGETKFLRIFFFSFFARVAICELLFLAVASAMRPGFYRKRVALKFCSSFPSFLSAHFIILPFLTDNNPPCETHTFIFMLKTCLAKSKTEARIQSLYNP